MDAAGGAEGATALIQAALGGHVACVKILAAYGADTEAIDDQGFTPAMWAGFRHPQDSALLSAIAAAAAEKRKGRRNATPEASTAD